MVVSGTDRDQQLVFFEVDIFIFIEDIDVRGTGFLHIVRLLRADIEQEGGRSTVDETDDTFVHGLFPRCIERFLVYLLEVGLEETDYAFLWVVDILFPAILFREGVQCPKSLVVTLCRDNRFGVQYAGQFMCQFVRPTDMTGQYRYDIFAGTVEADDCRVRVLALDVGGDTPYADTHRPDKHNRFRFIEKIASQLFERGEWFDIVICFSTIDDSFARIFVPDFAC